MAEEVFITKCKHCDVELYWDNTDPYPSGRPKPKEVATRQKHRCSVFTFKMFQMANYNAVSDNNFSINTLRPLPGGDDGDF